MSLVKRLGNDLGKLILTGAMIYGLSGNVMGQEKDTTQSEKYTKINISNHPAWDHMSVISKDDKKVAFVSCRDDKVRGHIYEYNLKEKTLKKISSEKKEKAFYPSYNKTANKLAWEDNRKEICVYDFNTNLNKIIGDTACRYYEPCFLGDDSLVYTIKKGNHSEIHMLDLKNKKDITISDTAYKCENPCTSYDNKRIAYTCKLGNNKEIYVYDFKTRKTENISNNNAEDFDPTLGKDKIAYTSNRDGNQEIYVYDFKTRKTENISNNSFEDIEPSFNINDTLLAYTSNRDKNKEIYIYNFANNKTTNISKDISDDLGPCLGKNKLTYCNEKIIKTGTIDPEVYVYKLK